MITHPITSRIDDDANKALKILEAPDGKTRTSVLSAAIMALYNGTIASAPLKLDLLDPSEILTLQSEVAAIEKLHKENRSKAKIRTFDKNATEKIIKAVEKIDSETEELEQLRLKLGRLAQLPENVNPEDLESLKSLATAHKDYAKQIADCQDKIAQYGVTVNNTLDEYETKSAEAAERKAKLGRLGKLDKLIEILNSWDEEDTAKVEELIKSLKVKLEEAKIKWPDKVPHIELELKLLTSLLPP